MANKIGPKIKEARTKAGMTMTELAEYVDNVSAAEIGKAERGEKELSQTALKQIAKATGVTQKSLLEAAEQSTYGSAKKSTTSSKKTSSTKTSTSSTKKTTSSSDGMKLTATEKKLVELYRAADTDTKKQAISLLEGEEGPSFINTILEGVTGKSTKSTKSSSSSKSSSSEGVLGSIVGNILKDL